MTLPETPHFQSHYVFSLSAAMASARGNSLLEKRATILFVRTMWSDGLDDGFIYTGPVTDYGSTMLHWLRNRQPRWKGSYSGFMERPSPSYIVNVSLERVIASTVPPEMRYSAIESSTYNLYRCYLP